METQFMPAVYTNKGKPDVMFAFRATTERHRPLRLYIFWKNVTRKPSLAPFYWVAGAGGSAGAACRFANPWVEEVLITKKQTQWSVFWHFSNANFFPHTQWGNTGCDCQGSQKLSIINWVFLPIFFMCGLRSTWVHHILYSLVIVAVFDPGNAR